MYLRAKLPLLSLALFLAINVQAAPPERQGYQALATPRPPADETKIEVVEFFWYGCPHCYSLEPHLEKWRSRKPADVVFKRVPAILSKRWLHHAIAYYLAVELGIEEKIHSPLFRRIHEKKKQTNSKSSLQAFFAAQGVAEEDFERLYESQAVQSRIKESLLLTSRFQIEGVPVLVVNGRYLTSGRLAGSDDGMIRVVNRLIEKERRRMGNGN
ncbi:MAG: thiol:disulfide interchange protein DsbA/DsbL [Gammaproteobacteria bacterium]|nr:thiol:disulfide interchange protein DsbA/DsbL [Gammaproteobacteria bacterium]MDD9863546.1 thiol:disulfide interchange protein DsbA/DsbL [Gammaproteobacteria bacterium]